MSSKKVMRDAPGLTVGVATFGGGDAASPVGGSVSVGGSHLIHLELIRDLRRCLAAKPSSEVIYAR